MCKLIHPAVEQVPESKRGILLQRIASCTKVAVVDMATTRWSYQRVSTQRRIGGSGDANAMNEFRWHGAIRVDKPYFDRHAKGNV